MKKTVGGKNMGLKKFYPLRTKGKSEVAQCKDRIQALLRANAIKKYGTCVLVKYPEAGECGGLGSKSGKLILQAEHLNTRQRNISYGDMRNIVLLCLHHHGFWKEQHSRLYWELIEKIIGPKRWEWLKKVEADKKDYNFVLYDWQKIELSLKQALVDN